MRMELERIIVLTGPLEGRELSLETRISIGRSPENELQLDDPEVSRKHAVIERRPEGAILRDLSSGNGTFVGDKRVLEYRLAPEDVIRVGQVELRYERVAAPAQPPPPQPQGPQAVRLEDAEVSGSIETARAEDLYQTFFAAPGAAVSAEQLQDAQRRLQAVYKANAIIASEPDLKKLFACIMDELLSLVPAQTGVILLKNEKSAVLEPAYVRSATGEGKVVVSTTIADRAFKQGEAVLTYNATEDPRFAAGASILAQNISSAMCAPLAHQEETLGVLYVDTRGAANAFTTRDLELLVAFSGAAATAIRNAQYVRKLEQAYHDTLIALANAVELRDHYTVGHTWRVTRFAMEMARELGFDEEGIRRCEMGGVLHDVGKLAVDDAILRKPGRLDDDEFAKMRVHPERGARLMEDIAMLKPVIPFCLAHHERYDGKGYPHGLAGEDIPLEGRVIAVADTFDAMTSNRPYRKGLDPEVAIEELEKCKGGQFDPQCVDAFVRCYRDGKIQRVMQDFLASDEKSVACPFCSTHIRIPEEAEIGNRFQCDVCHRHVELRQENMAYYGALIAQTEID